MLLIFGCSLSWAALDLTRKLLAPHMSPLQAVFWVAAGQSPVVAVWAANAPGEALTARYALVAGGSVVLNVVANTAFVAALARAPFSLTVPLLSLIPVMTAGFAMPLLGERLTAAQGLGVLAVVAGAVLLGGASAQEGTLAAWWRAARSEPGTALMLLVAVCWALALPLDKMGVQMVGAPRHGVVLCLGVALGTLAIMLGVHRHGALRVKRAAWGVLAAAMAVAAAGLVLQLLAIRVAPVGIVEAVKRAVGNLSALLLGAAMFREGLGWRKAVALLAMIGGVMLILLP